MSLPDDLAPEVVPLGGRERAVVRSRKGQIVSVSHGFLPHHVQAMKVVYAGEFIT
jgi:hypothetical protein